MIWVQPSPPRSILQYREKKKRVVEREQGGRRAFVAIYCRAEVGEPKSTTAKKEWASFLFQDCTPSPHNPHCICRPTRNCPCTKTITSQHFFNILYIQCTEQYLFLSVQQFSFTRFTVQYIYSLGILDAKENVCQSRLRVQGIEKYGILVFCTC